MQIPLTGIPHCVTNLIAITVRIFYQQLSGIIMEENTMKKILILNGAGKKNGNTTAMINAFKAGAAGNEITEFYLQAMNIHGCLDCGGCRRKEKDSTEPCVQKDDMSRIFAAFKEADVIVFASPVYWWDITGTLKTAIDRLYAPLMNAGSARPRETVLLMTSGGSTIDHMLDWYRNFGSWLKWKDIGTAMNDTEAAGKIGESIT